MIETNAIKPSGGRLIADDVGQYIATEFHVHYKFANIYRLMHQLGLSWITSRSKHLKQSQAPQNAFKKLPYGNDPYPPGHLPLERIDVWFQDEARFGQQNQTTQLWAQKGSRPRAIQQQQFEYGYFFGAICPANGKTEALVTPFVNRAAMTAYLKQISEATESGRFLDGVGWYTMETVSKLDNFTLKKLPPYSPELNSMEQWLRQRCLSNRIFKDFLEIVDQISDAWNTFISDVKRVKRLCSRDWIKLVN